MFTRPGKLHVYHGDTTVTSWGASNWWMPGGHGDSPPNQWPSQDPIDWRYPPYIRPSFQAYVRGYPHSSYGQTYGTNVPPSVGSWRSPIDQMFGVAIKKPISGVDIRPWWLYMGAAVGRWYLFKGKSPSSFQLVGGLEHLDYFPYIGNFIIPTGFHIFQRD